VVGVVICECGCKCALWFRGGVVACAVVLVVALGCGKRVGVSGVFAVFGDLLFLMRVCVLCLFHGVCCCLLEVSLCGVCSRLRFVCGDRCIL